jgi:hypothetical protein
MRPLSATVKAITTTVVVSGGGLLIQNHLVLLAGLTGGLLAALFLGVVLPAVWSTRSTRRAAALTVLIQILAALIRPERLKASTRPVHSDLANLPPTPIIRSDEKGV